jgi:hypothetical protein
MMSSTACVESPVAVTRLASGAGFRSEIVRSAVDLQLGDRAEPDADADGGQAPEIPLQS